MAPVGQWQSVFFMAFVSVISGLLGFAVVLLLVPAIITLSRRSRLGNRASDLHHTHKTVVPRLGGLALATAFVLVELFVLVLFPAERAATPGRNIVVLSSLAIFALGFLDDLSPIGAKRKLLGQIVIATLVWVSGIGIEGFRFPFTEEVVRFGSWGAVVTVVWLVGMTNLINLIDGVDGLAGGISLMLMGLLAYIGHQSGHFELLSAGMAGALLGFLRYNFPPARIYLGDGGAYFLGFLIGIIALVNSHKGTIFAALVAPLFVLALPIVDTALAILRRGMRGLPVFRPDRRHIHHKLLSSGFSRRQVVLAIYGLTLVFLVLGLFAYWSRGQLVPVLLGVAALILLLCAGNLNFSREWFAVGRVVGSSLEMRREVRYALSLTRWLSMEGARCASVESLWEDLVFAARKLGFTSVKLTLADGERSWGTPEPGLSGRFNHVLQGGQLGTLEVTYATAQPGSNESLEAAARPEPASDSLFEILSELLAEGWMKAATEWRGGDSTPLTFAGTAPARGNHRRGVRAFFLPTVRPQPVAKE